MDTSRKIIGSENEIEDALNEKSSETSFFSGSIDIVNTNSAYVFNFVNAETLSYILNEAKSHGEVTVEIFRYDEASEALQQQDSPRHYI